MSQGIRKQFYLSKTWRDTRKEYLKSVGCLCERCLKKTPAQYRPAKIVHHKTYLTDDNLYNYKISLDFSNLEALCLDCHNDEHFQEIHKSKDIPRRWEMDEAGNLIIKNE